MQLKEGETAVIVGDSAFKTNHRFFLTPFLKKKIIGDVARKHFNKKISRARVFVECIIGQLKSKFPVLKNGIRLFSMAKASM